MSNVVSIKGESLKNDLNSKNLRHMFDELNVKSTMITEIYKDSEKYTIEVLLISRYMDYFVDKTTNKFVSGNNSYRIEVNNNLASGTTW